MPTELSFFNVNHGFLEALVRGLRSSFLTPDEYRRMTTCETLDDLRSALEETDYGTFLQNEAAVGVQTIQQGMEQKLQDEFYFLRANSVEPATTILDFVAKEKMIDNLVLVVQGVMNDKKPRELESKLHPLGKFEGLKVIMGEGADADTKIDAKWLEDTYRIFLVDTPIATYFEEYLKNFGIDPDNEAPKLAVDLSTVDASLKNADPELMKATLKKYWLEDFYKTVMALGGTTAEVLGDILMKEADFRVLMVTCNALNTELGTETNVKMLRNPLYPQFGYLYPEGHANIYYKAFNEASVRVALEGYQSYLKLYDECKSLYEADTDKSSMGSATAVEDLVMRKNVNMYEMAFEHQFHFGVFYAWVKLKEQEIKNVRWIANMISLKMAKDSGFGGIEPIFDPNSEWRRLG